VLITLTHCEKALIQVNAYVPMMRLHKHQNIYFDKITKES
jgi:hypothetical protein